MEKEKKDEMKIEVTPNDRVAFSNLIRRYDKGYIHKQQF